MVTARQTGFISTITWNLAIVITGQATWYWGMTPTVFRGSSLPSSRRIFRHTTNSDPGNISRWEYLFVDVEVVLDGIFPDNALRKERALQRLYEKPWFLEEAEYPKEAAKIKEILNIMRKGDEFYLEEAKALLGCLLLEITRLNYTNKETRADAEQGRITCIVSRAMDYISDHYMEPIRVEQLAKYSHLSETHFRRVFTEYMHMGPLEYINTVRIRTACEH